MIDEMLCPDCGGVVGATEASDAGSPCTCFSHLAPSRGGNSTGEAGDAAIGQPPSGEPKICISCGIDVSGHRRVKDSRGYTCYKCAKEEIKKERGDRVRCRSCNKLVKESTLENYEGTKICAQCMVERKDLQKEQIKKIGIMSARNRVDRSRVAVLAGVGGLLLLLILLHSYHVF